MRMWTKDNGDKLWINPVGMLPGECDSITICFTDHQKVNIFHLCKMHVSYIRIVTYHEHMYSEGIESIRISLSTY